MNDLFKKLNTLVKASINDLLGDDLAVGRTRRRPLTAARLGKNIDREIVALRQRINEAVEYEGNLQERVRALADEVARWDKQADEAVVSGNDAAARYAVEQMQRAQQRQAMAESDLHEHQLVTQDLIQRVNTLEAVVADARRAQAQDEAESPVDVTEETETGAKVSGRALSDVLREARDTISRMGDLLTAQDEATTPDVKPLEDKPADDSEVEDDLERRRQRLSKPK